MLFSPLGDSAVVVTLGASIDEATSARVRALAGALRQSGGAGIIDIVPAYATVTVVYDASLELPGEANPYDHFCRAIAACVAKLDGSLGGAEAKEMRAAGEVRKIEIPVCYGGEFGPDLEVVARHCGLAMDEVSRLHAGADYVVHAVGFSPGFPYLGGLPEKLRTPRRASPRLKVSAGAVGIGWAQTGIYPLESPGGWQIIGRTPLALFRPERDPAALLRVGDRVTFRAVSEEEVRTWK